MKKKYSFHPPSPFPYYLLSMALNFFPALKSGTLCAGIVISFPSYGEEPFLSFLSLRQKVPNPDKLTVPFLSTSFITRYENAFSTFDASFSDTPVHSDIWLSKIVFLMTKLPSYMFYKININHTQKRVNTKSIYILSFLFYLIFPTQHFSFLPNMSFPLLCLLLFFLSF